MSDDNNDAGSGLPKSIFLVPYPKVIYLYPTFLASLFSAFYMLYAGNDPSHHGAQVVTLVFLFILALNLVVLAFDFPRTTSLTLFFLLAFLIVGLTLLFKSKPDLIPAVTGIFSALKPFGNATFYFIFSTILGLIFCGVMISVRFDYWEVRPNELLHHHGLWSDMKRYSAPNLRIDKEINDLFEFTLLRSGRLVLHPSNERRAIVLENVPFIDRRETEITKMLGALQVQVRHQESH